VLAGQVGVVGEGQTGDDPAGVQGSGECVAGERGSEGKGEGGDGLVGLLAGYNSESASEEGGAGEDESNDVGAPEQIRPIYIYGTQQPE